MMSPFLFAYREVSGRGYDYNEDWEPLGELVARFPTLLIPLPFFLLFLLIAYIILSKRDSKDEHWYLYSDDDNRWYKALIIVGWIAAFVCVLPAAYTGITIVLRIVIGAPLTIVLWLASWAYSFFAILFMICVVPMAVFAFLSNVNKMLGYIVGIILLCVTSYLVILFWDSIIDLPFMFPSLEFNL